MTVPGWDPIIQHQMTLDRIAELQSAAARERPDQSDSSHDGPTGPRTRLGLWLIRLGRAVAADRDAAESALRTSTKGLGRRAPDWPVGR